MAKVHTRTKRKKGLASTHRHTAYYSGAKRSVGAKSFPTLETAKEWMKLQKLSDKEFQIVPAKKSKKFAVKKIL